MFKITFINLKIYGGKLGLTMTNFLTGRTQKTTKKTLILEVLIEKIKKEMVIFNGGDSLSTQEYKLDEVHEVC